jgi:LAO/AO transport system kinase
VWKIISDYFELTSENNFFQENRTSQNLFWMMETINDRLKSHFYDNKNIKKMILENSELISKNEKSPFKAANELLDFYFGDKI